MDIIALILTAFLSVITLFIIAKFMGHKQIAQLDFFDYISGITFGSIAAELATELEQPWKPLIAMIIYGLASITLSLISNKFPKLRKYINGTPTIIMSNGKIHRKNLKKCKIELSEFLVLCRQEGYFHLNDIDTAIFEYNGRLTILPTSQNRPATLKDLNIFTQETSIDVEIIMDGRILGENLKRMGLNEDWLTKQLKEQGYNNAKQIFLGTCDNSKKVTLYAIE